MDRHIRNMVEVAILATVVIAFSACAGSPGSGVERPNLGQAALDVRSPDKGSAYGVFSAASVPGAVIPGLYEGAVPQGLAAWPGHHEIVISAYFDNGLPSVLMLVDEVTGTLAKSVWLETPGKDPLYGHVGGVAISESHVWVASDQGVYRYGLDALAKAENGAFVTAQQFEPTSVVASSASFSDGVLWIAEFAYYGPAGRHYETDPSHHLTAPDGSSRHAYAAGYRLDPRTDSFVRDGMHPDFLISIPDRVQGLLFAGNRLALSLSYGRRNDSTLELYSNPMTRAADRSAGSLPLRILTSRELIDAITIPPMAEGIARVGNRIAVLFESGAAKYRYTGSWPLDRLYLISAGSFSSR